MEGVRDYLKRYRRTCDKAAEYAASYVVVHPVAVEPEVPGIDDVVESMPFSLDVWSLHMEVAWKAGIQVAFENLPPSSGWPRGCLPQDVVKIVSEVGGPGAGACLDISHCFAVGQDPSSSVKALEGTIILGVHTSDGIRGTASDRHLPPGEGDADWPATFRALDRVGFAGTVILEVKSPYLDSRLLRAMCDFLIQAEGGDLKRYSRNDLNGL
jgi:sugar phosphate isomerase/epimerase